MSLLNSIRPVSPQKASASSAPVEISLDSDEDDDLEIVAEKRLTHKPVEKSPLEILVEQQKTKGQNCKWTLDSGRWTYMLSRSMG